MKRTFTLSETLCRKAIDYNKGGENEKKELKKYLKGWNLDTGYCLFIDTEKKGEIHIIFEHNWCHNYGLDHT